jgi:predicted RecB family nuclease
MYQTENTLIVSPSDLNGYLQCRHLTRLGLARARGDRSHEPRRGAGTDLVAQKGEEHEAAYLASLKARGMEVVEIDLPKDDDPTARRESLAEAARLTEEAMRAGAEVIYQATFLRPGIIRGSLIDPPGPTEKGSIDYLGHADFLFRVDRPSELGGHSYEVADAKLARRAKPYFLLQLCFYSELVEQIQGVAPERIRVILGTGEERSYRLADFAAYFRRIRSRFFHELADQDALADTYPLPCDHCEVCRWRDRCDAQRVADDHLCLVASIRRDQIAKLEADGIATLEALGSHAPDGAPAGIREEAFERIRSQAELQLSHRRTGAHRARLLAPEVERGFARLPEPSPGDVFFDMEGDPFFDQGLEYLFGLVTVEAGGPEFTAIWGRDRDQEREALERFLDLVTERRRAHPGLHVYHYAPYEITALKRLVGRHATREEELDQLLRDQVFVDLYRVVREAMQASQPSYSIKKLEAFYMEREDAAVTDGADSVIAFERWLESRDQAILDEIAAYNRDDCVSTWRLRDWLLARREEAIAEHGEPIEPPAPEPRELSESRLAEDAETAALVERLREGLPEDLGRLDPDQRVAWLLSELLNYHRREERPVYSILFQRRDWDREQLIDDADCIGGLEPDPGTPDRPIQKSTLKRLLFPAQETKRGPGDQVTDPATGAAAGRIEEIDRAAGWLDLRRGPSLADAPMPTALIPGGPYRTPEQRGALRRLASEALDRGMDARGGYAAARQLLIGDPPRLRGHDHGQPLQDGSIELDRIKEIASALDQSYLFIQGPPGAGKTYTGARLIVHLIAEGARVGVTSNSHKAIHNLLEEVEAAAVEEGVRFSGLKKGSGDEATSYASPLGDRAMIADTADNAALTDPEIKLAAGTAWHFCREDVGLGPDAERPLDYLFVDEAGQVSLADAAAMATVARNVVLLGDPQQLPQVAQGSHPDGTARSVLEHLLGDEATVPPELGLFLDRTRRMHPDVCAFISEAIYEGRLHPHESCAAQAIEGEGELAGTGVRWIPVEHEGHGQESPEEAEAIAAAIEGLLGSTYTDPDGNARPLGPEDVMVLTPYNAQVRRLAEALPEATRVGTVDRFQGQEAPVVLFSMATSSGEEVPRSLEFLFSRNRLNVAISRARCLAILVCSPRLLEIRCRTVGEMRLVNALCRLVELSEPET